MSAGTPATDRRFRPHPLLAPQLIQTVLATKRPVRGRLAGHDHAMHRASVQHLLDCGVADGDPVRLTGLHARQPEAVTPRGLAVLIHGWEGCHDSAYLYSMASRLYAEGWNVFRLNLRDHAGTHHLNPRLFHSARIDEVLHGIRAAQVIDTGDTPEAHAAARPLVVIGFSLGGNFALRVGLLGPAVGLVPKLSIGISPSIDPGATLAAIDAGPRLFKRYFLDKWRKTLAAKDAAWPGRHDFSRLRTLDSFVEITRAFVTEHTGFPSLEAYLGHYTLRPPMLMDAPSPLAILTAQDDTVIPFADFAGLREQGAVVAFDAPPRGGHCGFIENLQLESWAEQRVVDLLARL